jgi:hypothetical protein
MRKSRFSDEQIIQAIKRVDAGMSAADIGEGWKDNHKRVYRVYREENLQVRKRKQKRLARARCNPSRVATDRTRDGAWIS